MPWHLNILWNFMLLFWFGLSDVGMWGWGRGKCSLLAGVRYWTRQGLCTLSSLSTTRLHPRSPFWDVYTLWPKTKQTDNTVIETLKLSHLLQFEILLNAEGEKNTYINILTEKYLKALVFWPITFNVYNTSIVNTQSVLLFLPHGLRVI